jgi:hypothetical protein
MLGLSVDAIKDFQKCERLYDFRHNESMPEKIYSREIYTKKFENTIKNIIFYFWYKKQAGMTPSYSSLLNRWEKLWFPKGVDSYSLITEQHESAYGNMSSLTTKAATLLLNFYDLYSDAPVIPIGIDEFYTCTFDKKVKLEDKIDLIYRLENTNYVVKLLFNFRNKNSYQYQVDFAFMYRSFNNKHPYKIENTKFGYIDLLSSPPGFEEYKPSSEDVDSLEYWCNAIYDKDIFVPKRGMIPYCKTCPFDKPCSNWNGWNNG